MPRWARTRGRPAHGCRRLGLDQARRLGEALEVDAGWETAVETVLAGMLDGVLVDDPLGLVDELSSAVRTPTSPWLRSSDGECRCRHAGRARARPGRGAGPAGAGPHRRQRRGGTQPRRLAWRRDESVITREGLWLSPQWARVRRAGDNQLGVLAREREIQQLREQVQSLEQRVQELACAAGVPARREGRGRDARARTPSASCTWRIAASPNWPASCRATAARSRPRGRAARRSPAELEELEAQPRGPARTQTREARARLDRTVSGMGELEDRRRELDNERRSLLEAREEARMNAREASDQAHQLALTLESRRSAQQSLKQSLERMEAQLQQLQARREAIDEQLAEGASPIEELEAERQACLDQRLAAGQASWSRRAARSRRAKPRCAGWRPSASSSTRPCRRSATRCRKSAWPRRRWSCAPSSWRNRSTSSTSSPRPCCRSLAEDADPATWEKDLESLAQRIQRLEPVNLAAIQEYEEQAERKAYLDAQLEDLGSALETLENAIKKIDRETRQRFKETFDKVNAGMQELFPRLFGGGHGYLELTGDDLLSTGVTIMARPPGKRVSNISLLSGGEKAMTAVALVFSIFALNPAPFCLLDEVDAPLDEANVGRFSNVVKDMSDRVQFLFVTHNKSTMEAAEQMCGVTMREPGVSRLVQVDLAEAARLAGAA